jgi:shikimate O-hydroxycinnamoyltransferase
MKVEVVETTLVPPSEATPRHALWLSNLDLAVPKTHTPLVYYYPKPAAGDAEEGPPFFDPARLRDALARALVPFYPLAGRLASGPGGRIEIDCTGEGALFAVARADFAGDEVFRDFEPSPEARRLLVPFAESGEPPCVLAMVQVRPALLSCSASLGLALLESNRIESNRRGVFTFSPPSSPG